MSRRQPQPPVRGEAGCRPACRKEGVADGSVIVPEGENWAARPPGWSSAPRGANTTTPSPGRAGPRPYTRRGSRLASISLSLSLPRGPAPAACRHPLLSLALPRVDSLSPRPAGGTDVAPAATDSCPARPGAYGSPAATAVRRRRRVLVHLSHSRATRADLRAPCARPRRAHLVFQVVLQ